MLDTRTHTLSHHIRPVNSAVPVATNACRSSTLPMPVMFDLLVGALAAAIDGGFVAL